MTSVARVLVVGAVNVDLVVAADRLPGPGETVVGAGMQTHGGGKGANAAVAAARAGAEVRYCGAVGDDAMGRDALDGLRSEGIDVTDVAVLDGTATGTALIVVDTAGENQIAVGAGANAAVAADAVSTAVERAADWAGCVLVSTEIPLDAITAAVRGAVDAGLPCVLNTAPVITGLDALLELHPIVTPNATELRDLAGGLGIDGAVDAAAAAVGARSGAPVIVTLGGDGVLVADGGIERVPAPHVLDVRDTTGAGDTFNGVLAAGLAAGLPIADAARRGVAAASLSVRVVGARAGMPTAEAIDAALA